MSPNRALEETDRDFFGNPGRLSLESAGLRGDKGDKGDG
jgi:hypothetical protein